MDFTSIALILLSAFCHALWNFYSKSSRDIRILFFWCGFYTVVIAFIGLWYQASGSSETGMGLYCWLRTGSSVLPSVFDARLYSWRDFVCLSDYTRCPSLPATLCLSSPKGTNFGTRLGRHLMCHNLHSALPTTRGAHPSSLHSCAIFANPIPSGLLQPWGASLDTH